jgi:cbb3-type cytochrome oxidase subunit 3
VTEHFSQSPGDPILAAFFLCLVALTVWLIWRNRKREL